VIDAHTKTALRLQKPTATLMPLIRRMTITMNNNNNNNNNHDNTYGAIVMTKIFATVHPVHLMNAN